MLEGVSRMLSWDRYLEMDIIISWRSLEKNAHGKLRNSLVEVRSLVSKALARLNVLACMHCKLWLVPQHNLCPVHGKFHSTRHTLHSLY